MYVDLSGHDAILLNDSDAVFGAGHNASIVGDDKNSWTYFSKNGSRSKITGNKNDAMKFDTLADFNTNPVSERYNKRARITTSVEADNAMKAYGYENYNKPYFITAIYDVDANFNVSSYAENCANLSGSIIQAGNGVGDTTINIGSSPVPNIQYDNFVDNNSNVVSDEYFETVNENIETIIEETQNSNSSGSDSDSDGEPDTGGTNDDIIMNN